MSNKFTEWNEFEKELNITSEEEELIKLEMDIINATIEARKKNNLTQRDLSKLTGIKQPVIARIEKHTNSPRIDTLFKLLYPMGYTIRIVPLGQVRNKKED